MTEPWTLNAIETNATAARQMGLSDNQVLRPGDWLYFENQYMPERDPFRGENATYLGKGLILAPGLGVVDAASYARIMLATHRDQERRARDPKQWKGIPPVTLPEILDGRSERGQQVGGTRWIVRSRIEAW